MTSQRRQPAEGDGIVTVGRAGGIQPLRGHQRAKLLAEGDHLILSARWLWRGERSMGSIYMRPGSTRTDSGARPGINYHTKDIGATQVWKLTGKGQRDVTC